ncbi:hypothetical protein [Thalassobellus citreus]|uniref:hypothetical protein n=1 Tax=Thalassobellus citreus TaxID=3367752 RepID=UPI0037B8D0B9
MSEEKKGTGMSYFSNNENKKIAYFGGASSKSFKICNSPLSNNCSNIGNFKDYICNECKSELDCFHDVIFDAYGKDLNYKELSDEFKKLSEEMKLLSQQWGLCDNVCRSPLGRFFTLKVLELLKRSILVK